MHDLYLPSFLFLRHLGIFDRHAALLLSICGSSSQFEMYGSSDMDARGHEVYHRMVFLLSHLRRASTFDLGHEEHVKIGSGQWRGDRLTA